MSLSKLKYPKLLWAQKHKIIRIMVKLLLYCKSISLSKEHHQCSYSSRIFLTLFHFRLSLTSLTFLYDSIEYERNLYERNLEYKRNLKLSYALIHSHYDNGIMTWGNTFPTYLNKLNKLQKKAVRIVIGSRWNATALPLFGKINVLTLPSLFRYETAKLVHKQSNNKLLLIFLDYIKKSNSPRLTRFAINENF